MPTVTIPEVHVTLSPVTCYLCGITFAMPESLRAQRYRDSANFWCPNGHSQCWSKSEADRVREQLAARERELAAAKSRAEYEQQRRRAAEADAARVGRRLAATKAVVTRTKRKIVAGRCPCCSHLFKDVKAHMRTRHPAFDPDKAVEAIVAKKGEAGNGSA